jgi:hypothetical protein
VKFLILFFFFTVVSAKTLQSPDGMTVQEAQQFLIVPLDNQKALMCAGPALPTGLYICRLIEIE